MTRWRFRIIVAATIVVTATSFIRWKIGALQRDQSLKILQELGGESDIPVDGEHELSQAETQLAAVRAQVRRSLFDMLQPVALANCDLKRFGEDHDGGYLMCGNLLADVRAGYSYGISGYDKWGCDISTKLKVKVHQYDCFNTLQPACPTGETLFHAECVGDRAFVEGGRPFDTVEQQLAGNGDKGRRIVLKMDVEGAEWDSLMKISDEVLEQIDQMAVEFHKTGNEKYLRVIERLKRFFFIGDVHFNNFACLDGLEPFPAWAYEVLFVSRRLGVVDPLGKGAPGVHPLDAPNNAWLPDCQPQRH